jgi:hypothetical protein
MTDGSSGSDSATATVRHLSNELGEADHGWHIGCAPHEVSERIMSKVQEQLMNNDNVAAVRNAYAVAERKDLEGWIDLFTPDGVFVGRVEVARVFHDLLPRRIVFN